MAHLVLRDLRQIKALSDPLRLKILGALCDEAKTTKQIATELGEPATKLYRHVELLHELGLVKLVRTAPKRGTTEKYFEAVARSFALAPPKLAGTGASPVEEMFVGVFDDFLEDVRAAVATDSAKPGTSLLATGVIHVPNDRIAELHARLQEIGHEFDAGAGSPPYKLLLSVFPSRLS